MHYLVNKSGALIEVEDQDRFIALQKKGFTLPTDEQIEQYERTRKVMHQRMTSTAPRSDIFFATVTGGANGFGVSSQKLMQQFDALSIRYDTQQQGQKIGFLYHQPYAVTLLDNPIKIIYTMFESSKIPPDWKPYLDAADLILVPSHFCMEVFAQAGYNAHVIPLGFDESVFTYVERSHEITQERPFTFLHYDAFNKRKGFQELFKAFVTEFDPSEPVRLLLKTTRRQSPLPILPSQYPNIEVITGEVTEKELVNLCHSSDCFVFPSMGEGFGLTPLEAMGTGLPVIVPNAHGISEYFDDQYMYGVQHETGVPAVYARYKDQDVGTMIRCDIDDLRSQMRHVYENREESREKGRKAAIYARNFTYKKTAQLLKGIFDKELERDVPQAKESDVLPMEEVR